MCNVTTLEGQMTHARNFEGVDIGRTSLDEARIFSPLDACPDEFW